MSKQLEDYVASIPDFPKPGIIFRDVTTVLQDPVGFKLAVDTMLDLVRDWEFDVVAGIDARGFVFAAPIAYARGVGLVLERKPGKLPRETISETYELEYGRETLEMHRDAIAPGQRVLIVDDLIATGGTVAATARMIEKLGGEVCGCVFLMELAGLNGRKALERYRVASAIVYEGK